MSPTVARYSYDTWGKCTVEFDNTGYIARVNPFRYRGYYYDHETQLYYLNSRYYDPDTGRFINADSPEYVSIQGGNLFAYCGNCPTKNADYLGFCYTPTYPESYVPSYSGSSGASVENKKDKHFDIPAWIVSTAIDLALIIVNPAAVATFSLTISPIISALKLEGIKKIAINLIKKAVPKFIGLFSKLFTFIRSVIWKVAGVTLFFAADFFATKIWGFFNNIIFEAIDFIINLSTWGGFTATFLDYVTDFNLNGVIRLG